MPLITEAQARLRARNATTLRKSASTVLAERVDQQDSSRQHDVFLSHAFADNELILGVALTVESCGYSVYLDWRDDPQLSREAVNASTAEALRQRMRSSRSLLYATTRSASSSKWMPWELGFKDGQSGRAAILPVVAQIAAAFEGQEYLGIYPYVQQDPGGPRNQEMLWVHTSPIHYVDFTSWLTGTNPYLRV